MSRCVSLLEVADHGVDRKNAHDPYFFTKSSIKSPQAVHCSRSMGMVLSDMDFGSRAAPLDRIQTGRKIQVRLDEKLTWFLLHPPTSPQPNLFDH